MRKNRTWATELEILAASTIFNCDLYIFTNSYIQNRNQGWKWIKFPPQEIHNTDIAYHLDGNIYLHYTWEIIMTGLFRLYHFINDHVSL